MNLRSKLHVAQFESGWEITNPYFAVRRTNQHFNMGMYNILQEAIVCVNCNKQIKISIQFSFGDTWLFRYKIGDTIRWGGNDKGIPNLPLIKVYGLAEEAVCPFCNTENLKEYDIIIKKDVIQVSRAMESYEHYLSSANEGDYAILSG